jgi:hypothetical protein
MTSQCGAFEFCWISKATYTPTRLGTRTRAGIHTQICNIYCFSTATMIRERASLLRFTCIACLISFKPGHSEVLLLEHTRRSV